MRGGGFCAEVELVLFFFLACLSPCSLVIRCCLSHSTHSANVTQEKMHGSMRRGRQGWRERRDARDAMKERPDG